MKILVISNLYPPTVIGGYEILCAQLCRQLSLRGHDVRVLTSTSGRVYSDVRHGVRVIRALKLVRSFDKPLRGKIRGKSLAVSVHNRQVTHKVLEDRPDRVLMFSELRLTLGCLQAVRHAGLTPWFSFNDEHMLGYAPPHAASGLKSWLRQAVDGGLLAGLTWKGVDFSHSTCISEVLKQRLAGAGLPVHGAAVLYQGIPIAQFPLSSSAGRIRTPARLLYVGQLHDYKGVHTLIDAADILTRGGHPVEVTIVGKGPADYVQGLEQRAQRCGGRVRFAGMRRHSELAAVYREHDVFVFPSIWQEPFGLTHLEAMASGLPLVSTDVGGQREFLRSGTNALVFAAGDAQDLAGQVRQLLVDPALARQIALAGRETVERGFTLSHYVDRMEGWLERAEDAAA